MVNALARYQKRYLAPYLGEVAPGIVLWECSQTLRDTDDSFPIIMTVLVQNLIVVGPNLVAIFGAFWTTYGNWSKWTTFQILCLSTSCILTAFSLAWSLRMVTQRDELRRETGHEVSS